MGYRAFDLFSVCAVFRLGGVWESNHRFAVPFAIRTQKVARLLVHTFPDGSIYAKIFLPIICS